MNIKEKEKYIEEYDFQFCDEASKYEKVAKIGQGTFGEVFKAREKKNTKKFVALKKVLMDNEKEGGTVEFLQNFLLFLIRNLESYLVKGWKYWPEVQMAILYLYSGLILTPVENFLSHYNYKMS